MNLDIFKSVLMSIIHSTTTINPFKAAGASIGGAFAGQFATKLSSVMLFQPTIFFQHLAWTVAAIAGIISAVNGVMKAIDWIENRKEKKRNG